MLWPKILQIQEYKFVFGQRFSVLWVEHLNILAIAAITPSICTWLYWSSEKKGEGFWMLRPNPFPSNFWLWLAYDIRCQKQHTVFICKEIEIWKSFWILNFQWSRIVYMCKNRWQSCHLRHLLLFFLSDVDVFRILKVNLSGLINLW